MFGFGFTEMFVTLQQTLADQIRANVGLRFENSKLDNDLQNASFRLRQMTQERDDIQLRLHAIDHAYSEQQRSENKTILEQQETIRRQRQFISTLYTSRNNRKNRNKS